MKKIIRKFWGVALVVMMLSSLFVVAAPAAAGNFSFSAPTVPAFPTMTAVGFVDVAVSGDVVYALANDGGAPPLDYLYKSSDGGATWAVAATLAGAVPAPHGLPALVSSVWGLVAVAPDNPLIVAVVDTDATITDRVYLSVDGGVSFSAITALTAGAIVKAIDISPPDPITTYRNIAVGGSIGAPGPGTIAGYLVTWPIGSLSPSWTVPVDTAAPPGPGTAVHANSDILAVEFSPNYESDQALLFVGIYIVAAGNAGDVSLHAYSWNYNDYDEDIDGSYPRALATIAAGAAAVLSCAKADIALDEGFLLLDNEVGFVGAQITSGAAAPGAEAGNVWRINTTAASTPLSATAIAINSVAWDGANLMAAPYIPAGGAVLTIYRSATALTAAGLTGSNQYKTPGAGFLPIVFFAGGDGYCVSQGRNAAICRTTDLGKSFNGIAAFNSTFNVISYWQNADGTAKYVLTDGSANDVLLWRQTGATWERVMFLFGKTGEPWKVRAAQSDTNAVYLGKIGFKNMFKSLDGGNFVWTPRNCTQTIADFAVQSATILYVASSAATGTVVKTINGTSSWTTVGALGGTAACYSVNLIADNKLVVGGTTGFVGYYDGTTWTAIAVALGPGNTVVTASGLATGDYIFAASAGGINLGKIGRWLIGTSVAWTAGQTFGAAASVNLGIAYANGVLYVLDDNNNKVYRVLQPTVDLTAATGTETFVEAGAYTVSTNKLLFTVSGTTTTLYAVEAGADTLDSFTDFLTSAIPTLVFPLVNDKIAVNSINGIISSFVFKWNSPATVAGYKYQLDVYLDEAGTILVCTANPTNAVASTAAALSFSSSTAGFAFTGAAGAAEPGQKYYWRVRVIQGFPAQSLWTAMQSFSVQQLQAIVPQISTPINGTTLESLTPAFSWGPIAGVTGYEFQLATEPSFTLMTYTTNTTSSGAALPAAKSLTPGETYFWRVRAITPAVGEWSEVGNFMIAVPVTPTPPITPPTVTTTATVITTPTLTVINPTPATSTNIVEKISPAYIWAIIIIGAVLVIAVIVLIVRTRRTV
jgi:trimeric autotransporter adhesin